MPHARAPKILHVIQHEEPSGAEIAHLPLITADEDPLLACPPGSATERLAAEHDIATVALPFRSMRSSGGPRESLRSAARGVRNVADLRRLLKEHPERRLVVGNTLTSSILASLAAMLLDQRPVWVASQRLEPGVVRTGVKVLGALTAARIVVPSAAIYADFVGGSRLLVRRTRVVHPGIDLGRFPIASSPGDLPRRAALLGYISPVKRTDLAIEIARRVAARIPGFELLIVGRAQYRPEDFALERELHARVAADAELRDCVTFTGFESDVPTRLAGVGALLHCCPVETFGIAILEGMAAGLPVIAPAAGGPTETVDDGVTGLLYSPGDAEQAAQHLVAVLTDPHLAQAMGQAGRERVEREFSSAAYVARFRAAIGDVRA